MAITLRVSLAGFDALTETDQTKFSLYADEDNILIKEQSRGTVNGQNESVAHSIGYNPHFYAYGEISAGRFQIMTGYNLFGSFRAYTDNSNLYLVNTTGSDKDMRYFVFYDDVPT